MKVGDNWELEDNKRPDGMWMPGKGKRVFVDAKTPQETGYRDWVAIRAKHLVPGAWVRLRVLDVEDPTPDPDRVMDANDTADGIRRGDDNRSAMQFQTGGLGGGHLDCLVDADGVARVGTELP